MISFVFCIHSPFIYYSKQVSSMSQSPCKMLSTKNTDHYTQGVPRMVATTDMVKYMVIAVRSELYYKVLS